MTLTRYIPACDRLLMPLGKGESLRPRLFTEPEDAAKAGDGRVFEVTITLKELACS